MTRRALCQICRKERGLRARLSRRMHAMSGRI
jgi:hypothetical protein